MRTDKGGLTLSKKEYSVPVLVAAFESEIQAFPSVLPGWDRLVTGPGKLLAAVRLRQYLDAHGVDGHGLDAKPVDRILVAGTAGGLSTTVDGVAVEGGIFDVGRAIQHDTTNLEGVSGTHVALPREIILNDEGATIATGDTFIDSASEVQRIRALGADLVDMESYAYAWVAQDAGVPISIVKCVSDPAQDGATTLWDDVVASCSKRLWTYLEPRFAAE